ncbi:MAG: hypothetical protein LBU73_07325 [Helicobacteraceae bacterium]|nr:hypothetical protein [Helicobacteraceae bacterium]
MPPNPTFNSKPALAQFGKTRSNAAKANAANLYHRWGGGGGETLNLIAIRNLA